MPPDDDRALIGRSLADPHAFELVFDRHSRADPPLRRAPSLPRAAPTTSRPTCSASPSTSAGSSPPSGRTARSSAWLYGIATNLIRRRRRDERRQLRAYARAGGVARGGGRADADARVDARRAAPQVAQALSALSADERDVLLLYALAELDYQGIADALQIPIGTVRSRLARARARAGRHLAGTRRRRVETRHA